MCTMPVKELLLPDAPWLLAEGADSLTSCTSGAEGGRGVAGAGDVVACGGGTAADAGDVVTCGGGAAAGDGDVVEGGG